MRLPRVVPFADVSMDNVTQSLTKWRDELSNLGGMSVADSLAAYRQWAGRAAESLGQYFAHTDLDQLVTSRRHWWLMEVEPAGTAPYIRDALNAERTDRLRVFNELLQSYRRIALVWESVSVLAIVPDTNFLLHHEKAFHEVDWLAYPYSKRSDVRLLIPMAVVRQLDRQKIVGKNIQVGEKKEFLTTRARRTLRELQDLFRRPNELGRLGDRVTVELILDPLGRVPIDHADTEMIERTLAAKRLSGNDICIATEDLGMRFAAMTDGLSMLGPPE